MHLINLNTKNKSETGWAVVMCNCCYICNMFAVGSCTLYQLSSRDNILNIACGDICNQHMKLQYINTSWEESDTAFHCSPGCGRVHVPDRTSQNWRPVHLYAHTRKYSSLILLMLMWWNILFRNTETPRHFGDNRWSFLGQCSHSAHAQFPILPHYCTSTYSTGGKC